MREDFEEDLAGVDRPAIDAGGADTEVGILPLLTARIAAKILLHEGTAEAADPREVSRARPLLAYHVDAAGDVADRPAAIATRLSELVEHEVSPVAVVIASALAAVGPRPVVDKQALIRDWFTRARAAGKRPFAWLAPDGVLGRAGGRGRPVASDRPPTYEDMWVAEQAATGWRFFLANP